MDILKNRAKLTNVALKQLLSKYGVAEDKYEEFIEELDIILNAEIRYNK